MEATCNYQQVLKSSLGQFHQSKVNGESQYFQSDRLKCKPQTGLLMLCKKSNS